jgi:hypothetical protein
MDRVTPNPTYKIINWLAEVMKMWGEEWREPETVYQFSNDREFKDSGSNHGIYTPGS